MTDWLATAEEDAARAVWCARFAGHAVVARPFGELSVRYDPRQDAYSYRANHLPMTRARIEALDRAIASRSPEAR